MHKQSLQHKRKMRVRGKVNSVNKSRPRLVVTRSNLHIYAQIIDENGKILAVSSDAAVDTKKVTTKTDKATWVGTDLAEKAKKQKVTQVAFDRGHYKYHGRVKALAEAARSAGLEF